MAKATKPVPAVVSPEQRRLYAAGVYTPWLVRLRATFDRAGVRHNLPAKFPKEA